MSLISRLIISCLYIFFIGFQNVLYSECQYSVILESFDAKKNTDSIYVASINESIQKTILKNGICIEDTASDNFDTLQINELKDTLVLIDGYVGCINDIYYFIHAKLVNSSSQKIIKSVQVDINRGDNSLDSVIAETIVCELFNLDKKKDIRSSKKINMSVVNNKNKRRNQIIRRIISGAATIGFSTAGIIVNSKIKDLEEEYGQLTNGSQAYYNSLWNDIESYSVQRNALFSAAAGTGTLFLISIPF